MTKNQERHIIASVGTAIFMILVFLILWFTYLTAVVPEEEEGVEIAFGEVAEAGGYMAEQSEAVPMPAPEPATPVQPSSPAEEEMLTSEEQEALALAEAKKKREAEEKARLEAERKATARANDETRKLTARVAELRRKAVRKEDQLNETIRKKAQSDPCLDSHVDAAIIKQLRGTATGSGSTSGAH